MITIRSLLFLLLPSLPLSYINHHLTWLTLSPFLSLKLIIDQLDFLMLDNSMTEDLLRVSQSLADYHNRPPIIKSSQLIRLHGQIWRSLPILISSLVPLLRLSRHHLLTLDFS